METRSASPSDVGGLSWADLPRWKKGLAREAFDCVGDDLLIGSGGSAPLPGGTANDKQEAGAAIDMFIFAEAEKISRSSVRDFVVAEKRIDLPSPGPTTSGKVAAVF